MKKLFLTLIAVIATSVAGFAQISLDDAYTSLANLPGITEKKTENIQIAPGAQLTGVRSVICPASRYSQEFVYTYESLPINNMLIGANNQSEMACAFTEPSTTGTYNVFFIVGEKGGQMIAVYGQTNATGLEAIRNCEVSMQGDNLIMALAPQIDLVNIVTIDYAQQ